MTPPAAVSYTRQKGPLAYLVSGPFCVLVYEMVALRESLGGYFMQKRDTEQLNVRLSTRLIGALREAAEGDGERIGEVVERALWFAIRAREELDIAARQMGIADSDKRLALESAEIAREAKAIAEERASIARERQTIAEERQAIAERRAAIADERAAIAHERRAGKR